MNNEKLLQTTCQQVPYPPSDPDKAVEDTQFYLPSKFRKVFKIHYVRPLFIPSLALKKCIIQTHSGEVVSVGMVHLRNYTMGFDGIEIHWFKLKAV
jgi:hypothetical protein